MSPTAPFLAPERDAAFKLGRLKDAGATYYALPGMVAQSVIAGTRSVDTDFYGPLYVDSPLVVDQLAAEVSTSQASQNFRMGLYAADDDLQPIAGPLVDSGDISTATTGVKTYTPSAPLYLPRGRYLTVFSTNASTAQWRGARGCMIIGAFNSVLGSGLLVQAISVGRTYAAFPTPGTPWTVTATGTSVLPYVVFLRILQP